MTYSARELAKALGLPEPTEEQIRVIEAPLSPAMVIAGAGSGKTETMANRVVWLVANGHVPITDVLGMTFTRKAAGELAERIRLRLAMLKESGLLTTEGSDIDQATVTTYNSFAHRIYSQYAVFIGRDPDATILGEAAAWQLARKIAREETGETLVDMDKSLDILTEAILRVAHQIADNVADPSQVISYANALSKHVAELPLDEGTRKKVSPESFGKITEVARTLPTLVELATKFSEAKRLIGAIEFSDQVALALDICEKFPSVIADYQSQFSVILLDEYQDTSVVQAQLLARLFAHQPVMAVGDPHQSIYGWRGASADNIEEFGRTFGSGPEDTFSLSTSWRNSHSVLAAANTLVEPLVAHSTIAVHQLSASGHALPGNVDNFYGETILDEADHVAQWFAEKMTPETSAAMLCRSVKSLEPFKKALDRHNVAYHVVGVGGLLDEPVVVDLVCMLRVLHDVTADSELIRLLTGARWAVAPKDIKGLHSVARWLSERDYKQQRLDEDVVASLKTSVVMDDGLSLIDAIDFIATAPEGHAALAQISPAGLLRLRQAGQQIARLRRRAGADLRELVTIVQQDMLLDIEALAHESSVSALASLEAFMEPVTSYVLSEDRATLGGFLGWLSEAERRERLSPQSVPAQKGVVQIMTIHGSKGLEWDLVAIPRMVKDELPGDRTRAETWLGFGQLPYDFRGDHRHLPVFSWRSASTQVELDAAFHEFREEVRRRYDDEQRRLIYVAITRARSDVLLTGSFWATQVKPRQPGIFLTELQQASLLTSALPEASQWEENPLSREPESVEWPLDPLGRRRGVVEAAASAVQTAEPTRKTAWDTDISLLLAERDRAGSEDQIIDLPSRIPASKFKDYISDPQAVATALKRPIPEKPFRQTSLGTIFHSWVENRSAPTSYLDVIDAHPLEIDDSDVVSDDELTLRTLKETFERSAWASRQPVAIELEINVPFAGSIFICKIDAIYAIEGSSPQRFEIVDWKTGRPPRDKKDLELKQLQLALYRMAYATWAGISEEHIDAVFYFVADDLIVRPERIYSERELEERWLSLTGGMPL